MSQISPGLIRRLKDAANRLNEDTAAELLELYPSGELPPWGVTMCVEWLRRERPGELLRNGSWWDRIKIDEDDKGWRLDGQSRGKVLDLIESAFILKRMGSDPGIQAEGRKWLRDLRLRVRQAAARRDKTAKVGDIKP